jgi:hypothetical protein
MLCTLNHDVKRTTSMLLSCDRSFYLTHALECLAFLMHLVTYLIIFHRYLQYIIVAFYQTLIIKFYFH